MMQKKRKKEKKKKHTSQSQSHLLSSRMGRQTRTVLQCGSSARSGTRLGHPVEQTGRGKEVSGRDGFKKGLGSAYNSLWTVSEGTS